MPELESRLQDCRLYLAGAMAASWLAVVAMVELEIDSILDEMLTLKGKHV